MYLNSSTGVKISTFWRTLGEGDESVDHKTSGCAANRAVYALLFLFMHT